MVSNACRVVTAIGGTSGASTIWRMDSINIRATSKRPVHTIPEHSIVAACKRVAWSSVFSITPTVRSASWFKMLGDAEDSPIVDDEGDDSQIFGGIGVGWQS